VRIPLLLFDLRPVSKAIKACGLLWGQSVTLGDDEARRRGVQKSVLERKGPPTFTAAAEMLSRTEWRIHYSLAATIDALLAGILWKFPVIFFTLSLLCF
jgi:hypothetical protein